MISDEAKESIYWEDRSDYDREIRRNFFVPDKVKEIPNKDEGFENYDSWKTRAE